MCEPIPCCESIHAQMQYVGSGSARRLGISGKASTQDADDAHSKANQTMFDMYPVRIIEHNELGRAGNQIVDAKAHEEHQEGDADQIDGGGFHQNLWRGDPCAFRHGKEAPPARRQTVLSGSSPCGGRFWVGTGKPTHTVADVVTFSSPRLSAGCLSEKITSSTEFTPYLCLTTGRRAGNWNVIPWCLKYLR